ncbi:putative ATP-dependent helicase HrpB [Babesia bovis T2Bo]|uniref:ATP-dependent helicase, putative n=1 Tax=Babesia bovis TaxID=5865 RepID=A7AV53_BABBO|nr:putative ATP-dependent helicase HrpB [Babesia bovis T2Bo]EDO05679.1 putative ATP-dependent helicase HrpB [Babesia bovis T2Bo]|eukprot:XP_001609247.1 ATP-dependent helicase [Babesia bovis T2Bo]
MAKLLLERRDDIISAVEGHSVVVVSGCHVSYTSTYIPFFLYKAGFTTSYSCKRTPPKIAVAQTQDSDIASSANQCSSLIGNPSKVYSHVDCLESFVSTADIVYLNVRCMLKLLISDPLLSDYGVIVLTTLEKRLLYTETLVPLLKRILYKRSRLRIVLCLDGGHVDEFMAFFGKRIEPISSNVTESDITKPSLGNLKPLGRVFHINVGVCGHLYETFYLSSPCPNYLDTAVSTVWNICKNEPTGNVLVFLPSTTDIDTLYNSLMESAKIFREQHPGSVSIIPLYPKGSKYDQRKKIYRGSRSVYLCCDIDSHRSLLDVAYVVDCGFSRRRVADYINTGTVETKVISTRDEMRQRSNLIRGKGKCYRLLTEADFNDPKVMMEYPISEMKTNDLTSIILFIKSLGVNDFTHFEFLVQPPMDAIEHGLTILFLLGAIDSNGEIVYPCGNVMAELHYTPMLSNFLYRSTQMGCSEEALTMCAVLDVQDIVLKRGNTESVYQTERLHAAMLGFAAMEGDLMSYFNVYQLARYYRDEDSKWLGRHMINGAGIRAAEKKRAQLSAILKKYQLPLASCGDNVECVMEAIFKSFFLNVACKEHIVKNVITSRQLELEVKVKTKVVDDEGNAILSNELQSYLMVSSLNTSSTRRLYIHPSSFLIDEQPDWVVFNELLDMDGELYMRDVTAIQPEFLQKYAPHYYGELKVQPYLVDY